jgi:hypothetical protein
MYLASMTCGHPNPNKMESVHPISCNLLLAWLHKTKLLRIASRITHGRFCKLLIYHRLHLHPKVRASTARSMDCSSASAADCVCDCGEGVQCPNERKPIFFMQNKSIVFRSELCQRRFCPTRRPCTHYERTPAFGAEAGCGAGALPPHPQDFALWCLSRCGLCAGRQMKGGWRSIPLDRSRPLSRRSGCFPAFPYPPLSPG